MTEDLNSLFSPFSQKLAAQKLAAEISEAWGEVPIPTREHFTQILVDNPLIVQREIAGKRMDAFDPLKPELYHESWLQGLQPVAAAYYCAALILQILRTITSESDEVICWDFPDICLLSFLAKDRHDAEFLKALSIPSQAALRKFILFILPYVKNNKGLEDLSSGLVRTASHLGN